MAFRRNWYAQERPREVRGGIKAQSKTGSFAKSWWGRRWIDALESLDLDSRLARGKNYARRGQVISIDIQKGKVAAQVQGSRSNPYKVSIGVKRIAPAAWRKAVAAMASEAAFSARLLNGEMPDDIERAFTSVTLSLFPASLKELETQCTCPDWSNPCKHIAAVYYLLGEEFDRDPFLLFRLRGMEREELLDALGKSAGSGSRRRKTRGRAGPTGADADAPASAAAAPAEASSPAAAPLPVDPESFWGAVEDYVFSGADEALAAPPLLGRLGSFPFWRGGEGFMDAMEEIYRVASGAGMDAFIGQGSRARWEEAAERKPRRLLRMR